MKRYTNEPGRDEPAFLAGEATPRYPTAASLGTEPRRHRGSAVVAWIMVVILLVALGFVALLGFEPLKQQLHMTQALLADANRNVASLQRQINALTAYRASLQQERDGLAEQAASRQTGLAALQQATEALGAAFALDIDRGNIMVRHVEGRLVLDIVGDLLFTGPEGNLSEAGKLILRRAAATLKPITGSYLEVAGHTDTQPLAAKLVRHYATNWELSCARAAEVVRYLIESCGMPQDHLMAAGYADSRPLTSNDHAAGRRRNQRMEFVLRNTPP